SMRLQRAAVHAAATRTRRLTDHTAHPGNATRHRSGRASQLKVRQRNLTSGNIAHTPRFLFFTPSTMTVAPHFQFKNDTLHAEDISLATLAEEHGTPLYVYSRQALRDAWDAYRVASEGRNVLVCYGMKANSNLAVLNEFKQLGSGFDIVSGGELARVLAIGGDPGKIVFSGVGKQVWEMKAALEAGVKCFNVESEAELVRLAKVAQEMGKVAPVSLRVNPDVDAQTHPYISTG